MSKRTSNGEQDSIGMYISLLYNKNSKLLRIENLDERRREAARQAGVDDQVVGKDKNVEKRIAQYLADQFHVKFALCITKMELLWACLIKLREPLDEDRDIEDQIKAKGALNDLCDKLDVSFHKLIAEIYPSDMKDSAMDVIKTAMRPEERLKK